MSHLELDPRLRAPDAFLASLMERLRGLDEVQTRAFTARLILLLANQIGDPEVLEEAISIAARGMVSQLSG